ncbi:MAG: sialate O-acetylesterase, partial [Planctomycetes bacterium]|nr:sialate O-acetylesterase [Planctomycetota bacterium]
ADQRRDLNGGPSDAAKTLKVFVLAGQSNMEGHAAVRTFDYMARDPETAPILKAMRHEDGTPRVCEKVWISYLTGNGDEYSGKLTVGYGAKGGESKIGPEFTFGITMQKLLDEPILIIKTAWGGKSLHTDFRPPSAGPYELNQQQVEQYTKQGIDLEAWKADKAKATGHYYRLMLDHVKKVLTDIKKVYPDYDSNQGYELAGFVWFQGWNDMCDGNTYPNRDKPGGYDLYSELLAHFIRDVRKDLSAPEMPFIIGVMGVGGVRDEPDYFRQAMAAPAALPEFQGNVVAVQTAPFWDEALVTASAKRGEFNRILDTAYALDDDGRLDRDAPEFPGWHAIGTPAPEERIWRYVSFDVQRETDALDKGETKRFRDVTLPADMEQWYAPEFDDSLWKRGQAPIGTGIWKHRRTTVKNHSDWGDGEFLLMRTSFELDAIDCESYRLSVLARQGFDIYLNGHKIHTYIWWKTEPYYRAIMLTENETRHLRKGVNVLAAYANVHYERQTAEPVGSIDLFIEGITREGNQQLTQALERVFSAEDRAVADGASNAGFHYMGSAKIMAQIGKAFAEAIPAIEKKGSTE